MNKGWWLILAIFLAWILTMSSASAARTPCAVFSGFGDQVDPPAGLPKDIKLTPRDSRSLSWYAIDAVEDKNGHTFGAPLLAPTGWHCFYTEGTSGWTMTVSQEDMVSHFSAPTSAISQRTSGPAITVSIWHGETSGRFMVASYLSRFFPKLDPAFVQGVTSRGLSEQEQVEFNQGPYKDDTLKYQSDHLLEFTTPESKFGLGTQNMNPAQESIIGLAGLTEGYDFAIVSVRLPKRFLSKKDSILASARRLSGLN